MNQTCGCCEGLQKLTPMPTANRPGLDALWYRVGTHATFLATMKARLSDLYLEVPVEKGSGGRQKIYALHGLKTRDPGDPAIALLDAWATVADVLTFYQERIANEGYLRTATERRSILELSRLVGYALRPGVAASVYLAFTLENGYDVEIPASTRAQSLPGAGELPQSFETGEKLAARAAWNNLKPRMTRPQLITPRNAARIDTLYFRGTATNLKPNDPLLLVFGNPAGPPVLRRVKSVEPQSAEDRTRVTLQPVQATVSPKEIAKLVGDLRTVAGRFRKVEDFGVSLETEMTKRVVGTLEQLEAELKPEMPTERLTTLVDETLSKLREEHAIAMERKYTKLEPWVGRLAAELQNVMSGLLTGSGDPVAKSLGATTRPEPQSDGPPALAGLAALVGPLSRPASLQPASALRLLRSIDQTYAPKADIAPRLLVTLRPFLRQTLYQAWKSIGTAPGPVQVYALRVTASLFGHNAPKKPLRFDRKTGAITETGEWPVHEERTVVYLDASYDKILHDSWLVVETIQTNLTTRGTLVAKARNPNATISRGEYGISGKTTRIELADQADPSKTLEWINLAEDPSPDDFLAIRLTVVYAQSELLELAEQPIDPTKEPVNGAQIELGDLYDGLEAGRWLVMSGERTDIKDVTGTIVSGVRASELVMMASVEQSFDPKLPGDKTHTALILANKLAYDYKRDTVTIYGNVVKATHGETRQQVLGGGDAAKALQQFLLKQPPLTFVSAPTVSGVESTLEVRVNDVKWHGAESLAALGPNDRNFITRTDDEAKTTVIFGNGQQGARLPTGQENVRAKYRNGIGKSGNVTADQISLLATRPLGVKAVTNPLRASGGADKENRDQARRNAPLAVMALDRLVSTQDYADFARTFAGIGKASAVRLSDGRRQLVHVTIAGADDIPIDENSDLYRNLVKALRDFGDPYLPIQVDVRELMLLVINARVRLLSDYQWESVEPRIRAALLDAFSFERRELGQDVVLAEVISTIQRVSGVAYVDVDVLDSVLEGVMPDELAKLADPENPARLKLNPRIVVNVAWIDPAATDPASRIQPAQLAFLSPDVPDTLILTERTP